MSDGNNPGGSGKDREYLKQLLNLFHYATREGRYGVVVHDLELVVNALNRLDMLIEQTEKHLGCGLSHHDMPAATLGASKPARGLDLQLRLTAPKPSTSVRWAQHQPNP